MDENSSLEEFLIRHSGLDWEVRTIDDIPLSDFRSNRLDETSQELAEFLTKTDDELMTIQEEENARIESLKNEMIDTSRKQKADFERLLEEVGAWSPPNNFCEELKVQCMERLLSWIEYVRKEDDINASFRIAPIIPANEYRAKVVEFLEKDIKSRENTIAREAQRDKENAEMLKVLKDSIRPIEDNRKV